MFSRMTFGRGNKSETTKTTTTTTTMAPPPSSIAPAVHPVLREVTEDTPPDLLEGTMDLLVVLPSKKTVRMTVSRRTPMMDLLIQAATSNKIVPGGHIVQVRNERGFELPYKPSTPIGALDTTTIEIVPKNQVNEYIIVKKQTAKIANQPFEHTFRLQVHLPRNQLYVMRAGPKTLLSDILQEVCQEKNLDYAKYEMRHPVKLDEKLPLDRRLGDFGLQEVTVVSRNSRINSSVSTADIMALQNQNEASRSKGGLDSAFKHSRSSVGDSSVSSESAASARGISPSRSDDSRSISPLPPIRPKLKLNTTMSNASSSSGTSSALPKSTLQNSTIIPNNNNNYPNSVSRTSTSLTNNIIQAPPRTKKRAAPQPPTATPTLVPNSNNSNHHTHSSNNNMNHNVNVQTKNGVNVSLPPQSPLNNNANSNGTNNDQTTVVTTVAPTPPIRPTPRKKDPPKEPPGIAVAVPVPKIITTTSSNTTTTLPPPAIHHSRQSSDSSGYHEACVMCDNQETHVHHQSHRFDRQQSVPSIINSLHSSNQRMTSSVSVSNLTTVPSISSTSLASSNGGIRNKRKAPKPPVAPICILQAQKEIDEDISASLTKTSSSTNFSTSSTSTSTARVSRSNSESSSSIISQADPQPNSAPAPLQKITATSTNNKSEVPPPLTTTSTTTTTTSSKYRYRQLSVEEVEVEVEVHEESPVRRISVDLSEEQDEDNIIATSLPGSFDSTVSSNSSPTSELSHASTTSSPLPTQSATLIVDEGQTQTQVQSQKQDKTENKNNEAASPNKAEVAVPVPASVLNLEPEPATTNIKENAETIESSQVGLHTDYASVEVSLSEPQTSNNTIPSIDVPVEKMSRPVSTSPVAPPSVEDRNKALPNAQGDHREIQDDTVLPSSESEISYADSGVPATETITPSPIDADLGRSDKGISSGGSSRRSSVHSIDGTDNETKDNLRKILRAKIQKEQEIIDKAFEGIETAADAAPDSQHHDDDDDEDGLTLDSQRQNSNHNSNFDFAQPASMANLLSTSATSSPHPATDQTSDDDEREDDDEGDTSSNDDEEKELKFSSGDDSTTLAAHHTSLEKSSITGNVSNNSGSGSRKTGLGKSESFSHKSEFDAVKMKRRMFSKEGKGNAVVRKSYVSSSDEDLAHAARGGKIIGRGGGGSMQNLSSVPNNNNSHNKNGGNNNSMNNNSKNLGHGSAVNVSSVNSNRRKSAPPTKAASVVNMQEIDPDIAQNPALMESFKNELEAQFEQWKEQFMQKHLGSSKSGSLDNGSSSTSDSRKSSTVDQVDGTVLRSTSSDTPNKSPVEIEDTTDKKNDKSVDLKTIDSSSETSTATIIGGADDADETSRVITTTVSGTSSLTTSVKKSEEKIQKTVYVEKSLEVSQDTKESRSVENLSKGTNENAQNRNDEHQIDDSFDPEKPQIIHSVKSTSQTSTITTTTTTATNQEEETYCEPEIISQTQVFTETVAVPAKADSPTPTIVQATPKEESSLDEETSMPASKVFESQSEEMEPPVQRREKPVEEQPRIYRYTGPPTISMGTWGERPQRSVSVKRDRDYIMGMGTHDPKTTEVKPAIGSVATRIHSFLGNPVVTPVPSNHVVNSARPKSFYGVVVEASAAHNNNINNHYSNSANTSSSNSASNSNNSTMDRKVVASWKQRLEETEKERRSFQIKTPQSSIDIFEPQKEESRTSTQEPPSAPIVVSTKSNFNGNSNERPVVKKLIPSVSVESISSQNQHNQSSPPPLKISTSTYGETRKIHPLTNSFDGRDIILNSNSSLNNSISNKAMSEDITDSASDYSGSSNSRPTSSLSRAPSNASNNSNIVIASMTSSDTTTNSSFPVPASVSAPTPVSGLAEKKKFFQGIKPAESSAKETPIPAQNLKSNIATIQKVFQQRQQQQQQQQLPGQYQHQPSSLKFSGHGSSTGSSSPWTSKESSPAPSLVFSNNINNGSVATNSSAKNSTSFSGPSSSTMMVQKVMKAGSFDVEAFRRTPSPSTSSLSSMSTSSKSEDRETPSPVAINNTAEAPAPSRATTTTTTPSTNRFSIGSFEKRSQPQPVSVSDPIPVAAEDKKMGSNNGTTIKNMGNKSIIIVGNSNEGTTVSGNTSVSNNIFRQQLKVSTPVPAPTSQIQTTRNPALKVNLNGAYTSNQNQSQSQNQRSLTSTPAGVITIQSSQQSPPDIPVTTNKVSSIAANLKSNNSGFFSSLQRQAPRANSVDAPTPKTVEIQSQQQQAKNVRENDKPVIIEQLEKNRKISSNNSAPFNVNKLAGNSYGNFSQINNNHNSNNVAKVEITRKMSSPSINTAVTTASTATGPAPPPPPPMINIKDGVKLRTVSLGGERPKSLSMSSSSLSNNSRNNSVTSPTSPNGNADPRSNIMEAIKNSNGKFGLKKTGSSILLN